MAERDWTEIFTTAGVTPCSSGARVGTPFLLSAKGKPECAEKTTPSKITRLADSKTSWKDFLMDFTPRNSLELGRTATTK